MKYILLNGLGQTEKAWTQTVNHLNQKSDVVSFNLFEINNNSEFTYNTIYKNFSEYCNKINEPIALCGLSLGGMVALQYAIENPDKLNSLVLVGTQYKVPKTLLKFQNFIFKFMPDKMFNDMNISKINFINVSKSMINLDFSNELNKVKCDTLVLCGEKDKANKNASSELNNLLLHSKLEIIENSGHEVNVQNPKKLADTLNEFWRL